MQLSFSNQPPPVPHFLSFKASQEDRPRKPAAHDPPLSSGFMAIPTGDSSGSIQKQGTVAHQFHRLLQPHLGSTGQNIGGHTVNSLPFTRVPIMASPVSVVPPSSSIIGATDLRSAASAKSSRAPSQLTIFYAGSVCVYDDVSPEKSKTAPMTQAQTHVSGPSTGDSFFRNSCCTMPPFSGSPSHLSVTSHVSLQAGGQSSSTNELTVATGTGALASTSNQPEPPKSVNSVGSATTTRVPTAVPQARKASLARFLEKRKERASSTSPYSISQKSPDSGPVGSDGLSFSLACVGFNALEATN